MKIAYVSDSCGRPIHPRGIFNFSANLIKALKSNGNEIDLVIAAPSSGINKRYCKDKFGSTDLVDSANTVAFLLGVDKSNRGGKLGLLLRMFSILSLGRLYFKYLLGANSKHVVSNRSSQLDFLPKGYGYLNSVANFIIFDSIYFLQNVWAGLGMRAPVVKLSGYDVVVVDTPHHLKIKCDSTTRIIGVVHDIIPYTDPMLSSVNRKVFAHKFNSTVPNVSDIVFVSSFTKHQFNAHFASPATQHVLYPIFNPDYRYVSGSKRDGDDIIIVAVVSDEPRKNIQSMIDSVSILPENYKLNIVGKINKKNYSIPIGAVSKITFKGYLSESSKLTELACADVSLFVSLSEGFGIPVIEGLFYTRRIVCSKIPVFEEIVGSHGVYVDPLDPFSIADGLISSIKHPKIDSKSVDETVKKFTPYGQMEALKAIFNN